MSLMDQFQETSLQARVFDFAIAELVFQHRTGFDPLWTVDSWVKFLIWLALNCGLSGDKDSLENFAKSLGAPLTSRMRRIFFERRLDGLGLRVMADPAESQVLIMPIDASNAMDFDLVSDALNQVGLLERILLDRDQWLLLDAVIAIPWKDSSRDN